MRFTTEYQSGENDSCDYVINEGGDYPNYPYKDATKVVHEEKAKDKNYCTLFPTEILMKDKKFMSFFREMKKEFEDGCKQFTVP